MVLSVREIERPRHLSEWCHSEGMAEGVLESCEGVMRAPLGGSAAWLEWQHVGLNRGHGALESPPAPPELTI